MELLNLPILIILAAVAGVASIAFFFGWKMFKRQQSLRQELMDLRRKQEARSATGDDAADEAEVRSGSPVQESPKSKRKQVFVSYSHEDKEFVEGLRVHLSPVLRKHQLTLWSDSNIEAGGRWQSVLSDAIAKSSIAIAVVSPDYLASEFIQGRELAALIEAQEKSRLRLFWLPARPSAVETTELANYQALLNPGQPLSTLGPEEREIALVTVAETVARYLERFEGEDAEGMPSRDTRAAASSIRLESVRLRNIRCFEDITLDLNAKPLTGDDRLPSLRTVLVGDNATGKSTLLRSIALGICDESGATALLKKMPGSMIRSGTESGTIELHFRSDDSNESSVVLTEIGMSQSGAEIVRKSGDPPPDIVVVGYGTQRTRSGTQSHERYDVATAVGTLFDDEASLQNPELVLLRQPRWIRKEIQEIVAGILGLQSDEVEYRSDAVRVIGPWGQERLEVLSDGYRSTTQWILDFINWFVYSGDTTLSPNEVAAIVLFDELEQHLHPQWQRKIISRLRKHLPRVQFLITTHSPLIASSVTGLDENGWREKLIYFGGDEVGKVVPTESEFLRGMTVQQVLASPAFDYLIDAEPSVAEIYAEASRLASKGNDRTSEENERYDRVKRIVGEMLANQDTTLVEREAREDLNQQAEAKIAELKSAVFGDKR